MGKFGWTTDPEGNRFELWEPALRRLKTKAAAGIHPSRSSNIQFAFGGSSDRQNAFGVIAESSDCTADEATCCFGGDTELLTDFAEALALAVDEAETGLDSKRARASSVCSSSSSSSLSTSVIT